MNINRKIPPAVIVFLLILVAIVVRHASGGGPDRNPRPRSSAGAVTRLVDDFSSGRGWATFSSDTASLTYARGGYRMKLSRPADDAMSILILPGKALPSIAASAVVTERGAFGGLVGVGCADARQRGYLGAVDPAGSGYVILRADEDTSRLLQYGGNAEGPIRGAGEANELEIQCRAIPGSNRRTLVRLFSGGRLLAALEDADGLGPFRGMVLGGISLRRPLEAVFSRAVLQSLPASPGTARAVACERLLAADALEAEFAWLVDSGATRPSTVDFDPGHVTRVIGELLTLSAALQSDARKLEPGGQRAVLQALSEELQEQRVALSGLGPRSSAQPVDVAPKLVALSCDVPRPGPSRVGAGTAPGPLIGAKVAQRQSTSREFARSLIDDLPAPDFVPDTTLPAEPTPGLPESPVDVDFRYDTFRVFGSSIEELHDSLRIHGVNVRGDLVPAATFHELQPFYARNPLASGCALYPKVTLSLLITLPDWKPPAGADRYVINQWNEYVWELDDHERHHARLWIRAANAIVTAIVGAPPHLRCERTEAIANAGIDRVVARYIERNRQFDRDVAAGKLPRPSLP